MEEDAKQNPPFLDYVYKLNEGVELMELLSGISLT